MKQHRIYIRFLLLLMLLLAYSLLPFALSYFEVEEWYEQDLKLLLHISYGIGWFLLALYVFWWLQTQIIYPFYKLYERLEQLAEGDFEQVRRKPRQLGYWRDAYPPIAKVARGLQEASEFVKQVGQGNFAHQLNQQFVFSQSLNDMRNRLQQVAQAEQERSWAITGVAKFSDILRNTKQRDFKSLSQKFISNLVKYAEANQGALYVLRESRHEDPYLEMQAAYAYEHTKFENNRIDAHEGLLGQCLHLGETLYLEDIPENYTFINSGLGQAKPKYLILLPVKYSEETLGVIEIASLEAMEGYQQEFLRNIAESFGITLHSERSDFQTESLLQQAQEANEELKRREDLMRKNTAELEYTQQQLSEKILKIEEETNLLKHILNAIDQTNATIEFDMEGNIVNVNDMYLSVMGYSREELLGKNEISIVPEDEIHSLRYKMLWDTLKNNSFLSGEYRRISKSGKEIWLNGTYNPIPNLEGEPVRVIMLAQFTTEEKERELELTSKFNALSNALPIFEADTDSKILRVNQEFTAITQYKRRDLRNKQLHSILDQKIKYEFEQTWELVLEGRSQSQVQTINTKQGEKVQLIIYMTPIKNLTGSIEKVLGVMINITEQEEAKQALAHSQRELSSSIDELNAVQIDLKRQNLEFETVLEMFHRNAMAFELNEGQHFIHVNHNLRQHLNQNEFELQNASFHKVITRDFPKQILQQLWQDLRSLKVARNVIKYQPKSKPAFWGDTTIAPFEDVHNKRTRYLGIVIDVTSQVVQEIYLRGELVELKMKQAAVKYKEDTHLEFSLNSLKQELSQASNQRKAEMMKFDLTPVFRLNPKGYIIDFNRLVTDALGYNRAEIIGKNISDLITFAKNEQKESFHDDLLNLTQTKEDIYVIANQNGMGNYANTLLTPFHNPNNQQFECLMFFTFI